VQVSGTGSGFEGAAAVLGSSNIIQMMSGLDTIEKNKKKVKK